MNVIMVTRIILRAGIFPKNQSRYFIIKKNRFVLIILDFNEKKNLGNVATLNFDSRIFN